MTRLAQHAVAVLLGAAVALGALVAHRAAVLGLPLGLLLAAATTWLVAVVLRREAGPVAASYVAGWLVLFGLALLGRPEGDYAVAGDLRGYGVMAVALVVTVIGVMSLASPQREALGSRN